MKGEVSLLKNAVSKVVNKKLIRRFFVMSKVDIAVKEEVKKIIYIKK